MAKGKAILDHGWKNVCIFWGQREDLTPKKIFAILVVVVAVGLGINEALFLTSRAFFHSAVFAKAKYNYTNLVNWTLKSESTAVAARHLLPPGSTVEFSPGKWDINKIAMRYLLYPIRVQDNAGYFLDWDKTIKTLPPGWQERTLRTGIRIYAKEGYSFLKPLSVSAQRSQVFAFLLFGTMSLFQLFVGRCLLTVILGSKGKGSLFMAHSYLLGYFVLTAAIWIFLLLGGRLGPIEISVLWLVIGSLAYVFMRAREPLFQDREIVIAGLKKRDQGIWLSLARLGFILTAGQLLAIIFQVPLIDWDGMSHWVMKSKVFFYENRLAFDYTHNNSYPLLWSLGVAVPFVLWGEVFDPFAQWLTGIFFLTFMVQLVNGFRILEVKERYVYLLGIFYLVFTFRDPLQFLRDYYYIFANAENIFMAYFSAMLTAMVIWAEDPSRAGVHKGFLKVAVLSGVALSLVKLEGSVTALCLVAAALVWTWRTLTPSDGKWLTGGALISVLLPGGWMAWLHARGYASALSHFREGITADKIVMQASLVGQNILTNNMLLIFLMAFACIFVFGNGQGWKRIEKFLLLLFVLLLSFSAVSSLGWPKAQTKDIFAEVFPRLFFHATPVLVFLWASRMKFLRK